MLSFLKGLAIFVLAASAWAQTGAILYNFTGGKDGLNPKSNLIFDAKGNMFGTTTAGGDHGQGTVFELMPGAGGTWTESVLYSFQGSTDGGLPAAGLVRDKQGNLYGTTYMNGALGHGAVFELQRSSKGWTEKVLYSFSGGNDGGQPVSGVIFDGKGNLYGTTLLDGPSGQGVVFKLTPHAGGKWTETVLYAFTGQNGDGSAPGGSLLLAKSGNLYGLTVAGGISNQGTAFQLVHKGGKWTENVIYKFLGGNDGAHPATTNLISNAAGTLFATTTDGGTAGLGTVFQLKPLKNGGWKETVLYSFPGGTSGGNPYAGVVRDAAGNLYGTTASGVHGGGGVVFKLTRTAGNWTETVLYTVDNPGNGSYAGLLRDKNGNLFGTTEFGGPQFAGNVFEVTP